MTDDVGNLIMVGDRVQVTSLNADRGAILTMTNGGGTVTAFGRTRVRVQFDGRNGVDAVGGECLHITTAVDNRKLTTWTEHFDRGLADVHN